MSDGGSSYVMGFSTLLEVAATAAASADLDPFRPVGIAERLRDECRDGRFYKAATNSAV